MDNNTNGKAISGISGDGEEVVAEQLIETSYSWDGAPLPVYPGVTPKITIKRFVIPPHRKLAMHKHPVINCGVILKGELTIVTENGVERTFKAGEPIVEVVDGFHYGENRGTEKLEFFIVYSGAEGLPISIPKE